MGEGQDEEREGAGVTSGEQRGRQKREMERLGIKRERRLKICEYREYIQARGISKIKGGGKKRRKRRRKKDTEERKEGKTRKEEEGSWKEE